MKRNASVHDAYSLDDVRLIPQETAVKPSDVSTATRLTKTLTLNLPFIAAPCPAVTESRMAIALARLGGLGIIHDQMPVGKQVEEVRRVKRATARVIGNPITVAPETSLAEAVDLMRTYKISGLPVVDTASQKVVGILTARDVRFAPDTAAAVSDFMSKNIVTAKAGVGGDAARKMMHEKRIEKLIILDDKGRCAGLITHRDMAFSERWPQAARDAGGRLLAGAAIGTGKDAFDRAGAMTDAGLDVLFIDAPHGHTKDMAALVSRVRQQRSSAVQIVAGNVATADAARSLVDAGADAIKIKGDMPSFTMLLSVAEQCEMMGVPALFGGPVACADTAVRALAAGAEAVILGSLIAGADEAPGVVTRRDGRVWKIAPRVAAPRDMYEAAPTALEYAASLSGDVEGTIKSLSDTLRLAMAMTGTKDVRAFIDRAEFARAA